MKKIIFIILFLLFQSFPSLGSPIDKGLVCRCNNKLEGIKRCPFKYPIRVFFFSKEDVFGHSFGRQKDTIKIYYIKATNYYLTANTINWYFKNDTALGFSHTLNRKTLELKSTNKAYSFKSNCEIIQKQNFQNTLQNIQKLFQSQYDIKRKDNKI